MSEKPCCTPEDVAKAIDSVRRSYVMEERRGEPGFEIRLRRDHQPKDSTHD